MMSMPTQFGMLCLRLSPAGSNEPLTKELAVEMAVSVERSRPHESLEQ